MQFVPIKARAMDGVLLDACGDPVTGAASYFAISNGAGGTGNFIRASLTPDYFTPADIVGENGAGKRYINVKGTPQLQGYRVQLELAGLTPAIEAGLLGDSVLKSDGTAPTVATGVKFGQRATDSPGWAFRFYQDVDSSVCGGSGIPSVVHWLARVDNWQKSGDFTLSNGLNVKLLEGYATTNAAFEDGPFGDVATAFTDDEIYAYDLAYDVTDPTDTAGELVAWPIV